MDPIVNFLKGDTLPEGKLEAEKIRRNAHRFWLSKDHKLYRRSYSGPYLLCIHPEEYMRGFVEVTPKEDR